MPRAERNGDCQTCGGRIRHYPPPDDYQVGGGVDSYRPNGPTGAWAHLNRADWLDDPHDPVPTAESLAGAALTN